MKLKELESYLSQCEPFTKPKVELEQYPTTSHIASRMLYAAQDDIKGGLVCDLGSGCGILSIGSVLVGAAFVCGVEIDPDAMRAAQENVAEVLDEDSASAIDFLQVDICPRSSESSGGGNSGLKNFGDCFDVVVMNPPFGTKNNEGIDWSFVQVALQLVKPGGRIYSLHKSSTRSFFTKKFKSPFPLRVDDDGGEDQDRIIPRPPAPSTTVAVRAKVLAEVQFDLPKVYKFHKEKSVDISVDFWCFEKMAA